MEFQISNPHFSEKSRAVDCLHQVLDPELMVNIIDLGLVYNVEFLESKTIVVTMTLTSHACPLGEAIEQGVKNVLTGEFNGFEIITNIVWEPQWTFEDISVAGRQQLGF